MERAPGHDVELCGEAAAITLLFSSGWFGARLRKTFAPLAVRLYETGLIVFRKRDDIGAHALRSIHFLQLFYIMEWPYVGPPQKREYLGRYHQLLMSNYNGGVHKYLDDFADGTAEQLRLFLRGSDGYQKPYPVSRFREFIRGQIVLPREAVPEGRDRQHYFGAYPQASARDVDGALRAAHQFDKLAAWIEKHPDAAFTGEFATATRAVHGSLAPVDGLVPSDRLHGRAGARYAAGPGRAMKALLGPLSFAPAGRALAMTLLGPRQLTLLCPYDPGRGDELMAVITEANQRPRSLFARLPGVHFARVLMLDNTTFPCPATVTPEPLGLQNGYLIVNLVFDGQEAAMVEALYQHLEDGLGNLLKLCYRREDGFAEPAEFAGYVKRCRVTPSWHFRDNPGRTVGEIRAALWRQRALIELLAESPKDGQDVGRRFRARAEEIRNAEGG